MTRCLQSQLAATVFLLAGGVPSGYTSGQQADDRGVPALVTRVYAVVDLALSTPDYEYQGQIPSTAGGVRSPWFRGGGGFGGGGDTGGGGIFSVPSDQSGTRQRSDFHHLAQIGGGGISGGGMGGGGIGGGFLPAHPVSMVLDFDSLIEVITSVIEPDSWDENGGPGSLSAMGALLCVRQTEPVHTQIQQLLDDIRREGGRLRSVTVEARWLLLDSQDLDTLVDRSDPANSRLKSAELEKLTREETSYRGQITCFSGQQVFIVAGRRQSVFSSVIPVVGSGIGYQPVVQVPNVGVLLQVRPTLLPHDEAAILDVRSTVTDWQDGDTSEVVAAPPRNMTCEAQSTGGKEVPADHVSIKAHELATALRVSLGESVLIGGLTLVPSREVNEAPTASSENSQAPQGLVKKLKKRRELAQLYLVIKVTAAPQVNAK